MQEHPDLITPTLMRDEEIAWNAKMNGMIVPFTPMNVNANIRNKLISFGLSSFGYDLRLSDKDFRIFQRIPGEVVDPKRFNPLTLTSAELHTNAAGESYFILPANSYGLGVAVEKMKIPEDTLAICLGKSTYARCGIIANVTPAEPGWEGHLTLEFSNSSAADCKLYANEGIVQMLFFRGTDSCDVSYKLRRGKYQGQGEQVVLPTL